MKLTLTSKMTRRLETTLSFVHPWLWPLHAKNAGVCMAEVYQPQQHSHSWAFPASHKMSQNLHFPFSASPIAQEVGRSQVFY